MRGVRKGMDVAAAMAEAEKMAGGSSVATLTNPAESESLTGQPAETSQDVDTSQEEAASLEGGCTSDQEPQDDSQGQETRVTEDTGDTSQGTNKVTPDAVFPFSLQRKGKEYGNLSYKDVVAYAQMGLNHDIRGKELNTLQSQLSEREKAFTTREQSLQPITAFDEWMRSDPQLAALVEQTVWNYQQGQAQPQGGTVPQQVQQPQPQPTADPRVEEMYQFIKQFQEQAADAELDRMMDTLRQGHPTMRWDVPDPHDPEGRTPEDRIYDFMAQHNVNDPETAYRALFYDADLSARETAAKQSMTQQIQQKHRQGAVLASRTPAQPESPSFNFDQLRGKRPGDIAARLQGAIETGQLPV